MRRPALPIVLAACLLVVGAAPAGAQTPLEQYQTTGRIDPCKVSGGPGQIPNDIEQYAPDFLAALNDARARGCDRGNPNATTPTRTDEEGVPVAADGTPLPPGSSYVPKPPAPPRLPAGDRATPAAGHLPLAAKGDAQAPAPVIALAIFVLLGLAAGGLAATWRYMGWGLDWLDPVRHGFAEAGHRLGAAAGWLRSGLSRRG